MVFLLAMYANCEMDKSSLHSGFSLNILKVKNISFSFSATRAFFNHIFLDRFFIHNLFLFDLVDINMTLSADPCSFGYVTQLQTFDVEGILTSVTEDHFSLIMFL